MPSPRTVLRVNVDRVALVRAIRVLQVAERRESRRATVTFGDGRLTISLGEMAISAQAIGTWDGEVRIVGRDFRSLDVREDAEVGSPTVPVTLQDGRFFVGPISCLCTWRKSAD